MTKQENLEFFKELVYFHDYAAASYGYPFYMYRSKFACLKLMPSNLKKCFGGGCSGTSRLNTSNTGNNDDNSLSLVVEEQEEVVGEANRIKGDVEIEDGTHHIENDNCCLCYYNAVVKQLPKLSESTENLDDIFVFDNIIKSDSKKQKHIKILYANFSSDVSYFEFLI